MIGPVLKRGEERCAVCRGPRDRDQVDKCCSRCQAVMAKALEAMPPEKLVSALKPEEREALQAAMLIRLVHAVADHVWDVAQVHIAAADLERTRVTGDPGHSRFGTRYRSGGGRRRR